MVLALTPLFLDARFREQATASVLSLVTRLTRKAIAVAGKPDAGIWEYRSGWRPQTFSSLMCWAAADRMNRIARLHLPESAEEFGNAAGRLRDELLRHAIDPSRGCLVADYGGTEVDAALLQAVTLRLLPAEDPRLRATVDAVWKDLEYQGWLKRYRTDDGFGAPAVAFMLCMFWLIEALVRLGRQPEARALMERVRDVKSPLGLLAEDFDPVSNEMSGNFPQAYSHVGLIHAAFAASPRWSEMGS
jgi:GH15 family glucan-1,4-alpha-glucosidase